MSTSRLEAFSDGVLAIAITLLVLEIHVPTDQGADLWHALGRQWPSYVGFVVSFVTIGIIWVNHHTLYQELARVDRTLLELLNELRVALPGVQVLFAFLLVVPFNQRFDRMSEFERDLYFGVLLCTGIAAVLLIAPSMHHRLEFRHRDKEYLVEETNRLTIAGLSFLAVAMTGAIALITHLLFGTAATVVTTAVVLLAFGVVRHVIPPTPLAAVRRRHH